VAKKLTNKEDAFCREYVVDWNATQAAIRAGYSKNSARQSGADNMKKPDVKARIRDLIDEQNGRLGLDADFVISRFMALADFSIKKVATFDGETFQFKSMAQWPENADRAVKSIKQTTKTTARGDVEVTLDVKFEDKQTALEALGRHLGLFMSFDQAITAMETYGYTITKLEDGTMKLEPPGED
jgi:phage terminase small subunit